MKTSEIIEILDFIETKLQAQSKLIKEINDKLDKIIEQNGEKIYMGQRR